MQFTFPNGSTFLLKNVRHVPKLTKSLISTGQLDDLGYAITFGSQSSRIQKGSLIIALEESSVAHTTLLMFLLYATM